MGTKLDSLGRHLDLLVLAAALPVFVLADLAFKGYLLGAGAWLVQKVLGALLDRRSRAESDPKTVLALTAGGGIVRGWLVAITILVVGLADEDAGLAAAVLIMAVFTAYFISRLLARPSKREEV